MYYAFVFEMLVGGLAIAHPAVGMPLILAVGIVDVFNGGIAQIISKINLG